MDDDLRKLIKQALDGDIRTGEVTTNATITLNVTAKGHPLVKEDRIIAGLSIAESVYKEVDNRYVFYSGLSDGSKVSMGDIAGVVKGPLHLC